MPIPFAGDILSRKSDHLVVHYGVAVNGHQVLDIVRGGAPRIVSLARFADGKPVTLHVRPNPADLPAIYARMRQRAASQDPYDILTNNCEHLKNFVLSDESYSETVQQGVFGLLLVVGLYVLTRGRAN